MEYVEDSDQGIDEWQQIKHPFPDETFPTVDQSSGGWSTVVISEDCLLHHEASQIVPADPEDGNSSPSSRALSSLGSVSDEDVSPMPMPSPSPSPSGWRLRVADEGRKLLKLRFDAIRNSVVRVASKVHDYAVCTGAFWSIMYVTGAAASAAAVLLIYKLYIGIQRRRWRRKLGNQQGMDHLRSLLREKDEVNIRKWIKYDLFNFILIFPFILFYFIWSSNFFISI